MSDDAAARAALEGIAARYRGVIDAAVDGIIIIDEQGTIETFNPAAERMFGYTEAEVLGRNVSLLMPAHHARHHDGYLHNYLDGGEAKIIGIGREVEGLHKRGDVFPLELAVGEVSELSPRRFVGTVRDISSRRRLETALSRRDQALTVLIDHAPIGIFAAALDGRIRNANPALCRLVGFDEEQLCAMSITDLTLIEDRERLKSALQAMLADGKSDCRCELRWFCRDRAIIDVTVYAVVADVEGGLLIGQVIDRTEQLRSERESREASARLAQVGRVTTLGEMASAIAHEINQPLTAISAYAQACKRLLAAPAADPAVLTASLESIAAQALRAGDVVRRIRGFISYRDAGREMRDLNDIVRDSLAFADIDLHANQVAVVNEAGDALPPVLVDEVQIQQVCLNLIRNAVDAMRGLEPVRRNLSLRTYTEAGKVVLECIDNGPGVAPEMRERLFQPFQTTKEEGMGMGLSISGSIVRAHGGTLDYVDVAARGACFRMSLPAAASSSD
ncbi:MAG: PAS domain-containing sensor histidine kinase [Gammaproteobacteria bacterium]